MQAGLHACPGENGGLPRSRGLLGTLDSRAVSIVALLLCPEICM